ncbi:TetR/AcrR family transcriptional regulator [Streptomyces sp. NPDC005794]|uniref:TetR/AcrR family transcriptional regulator n=1 Tax=Streptomyces sp. NPDC005794 TaxID=3364733 RepID=UPI003679F0AE
MGQSQDRNPQTGQAERDESTGRASRAQAAEHREQIVAAASRLFREQGFEVSLTELTGTVGLTTGGFCRQFDSKDTLADEATGHAFEDLRALLDGFEAPHTGDHDAARTALIDYYLSPGHRDDTAHDCPASGLSADISRRPAHSEARQHVVEGVRELSRWLDPPLGSACSARRSHPRAASLTGKPIKRPTRPSQRSPPWSERSCSRERRTVRPSRSEY